MLPSSPMILPSGHATAMGVGVRGITFPCSIIGDLVPDCLSVRNFSGVASPFARLERKRDWPTKPVAQFPGNFTEVLLRPGEIRFKADPPATDEEVRASVEAGRRNGTLFQTGRKRVAWVFVSQCVGGMRTPRGRIARPDAADADGVNWGEIAFIGAPARARFARDDAPQSGATFP